MLSLNYPSNIAFTLGNASIFVWGKKQQDINSSIYVGYTLNSTYVITSDISSNLALASSLNNVK